MKIGGSRDSVPDQVSVEGNTMALEKRKAAGLESSAEPVQKPASQSVIVSRASTTRGEQVAQSALLRQERIDAVRAAVSAGTYRVDKDKLVVALLDEELARAGRS